MALMAGGARRSTEQGASLGKGPAARRGDFGGQLPSSFLSQGNDKSSSGRRAFPERSLPGICRKIQDTSQNQGQDFL